MPIDIPDHVVQFLDRATVAIGGTRSRDLVPHVHRLSGWRVRDDRRTITCLVPDAFTPDLMSSLEDNGRFALTVSEAPSHETYQLKGRFTGTRAIEDADLAVCARHREDFTQKISQLFQLPEAAVRAYVPDPSVAFDFAVDEIFLQTPGPDAGKRILPDAE